MINCLLNKIWIEWCEKCNGHQFIKNWEKIFISAFDICHRYLKFVCQWCWCDVFVLFCFILVSFFYTEQKKWITIVKFELLSIINCSPNRWHFVDVASENPLQIYKLNCNAVDHHCCNAVDHHWWKSHFV